MRADIEVEATDTQAFGDAWLAGGEAPLMRVPNVIVPESFNILLNPMHLMAGGTVIVGTWEFDLDQLLFG